MTEQQSELEQLRQQVGQWKRRALRAEGAAHHTLRMQPYILGRRVPETATEVIDRLHEHIRYTYPDIVIRYEHQAVEVYQWADGCACENDGSNAYEAAHDEVDEHDVPICTRTLLGVVCDNCKDEDGDGPEWLTEGVLWQCPPIAELNAPTDAGVLAAAMSNPIDRSGCPDPIECSHEASQGEAEARLAAVLALLPADPAEDINASWVPLRFIRAAATGQPVTGPST
jgi:hypothetical protein